MSASAPTAADRYTIPIQECGEPLVMLDADRLVLCDPHPYKALGAVYPDGVSPYMLRQSAADKLYAAQEKLTVIKPGYRLLIWDGLRPINVQKMMVDLTFRHLVEKTGRKTKDLSSAEEQDFMTETLKFWSLPTEDLSKPPLHSTGGAVDLTIVDAHGSELDMGTVFDHPGEESQIDYFADRNPTIHANRMLLKNLMEAQGFLNYATEWWHYGYGDQLSALLKRRNGSDPEAFAIYGRVTA